MKAAAAGFPDSDEWVRAAAVRVCSSHALLSLRCPTLALHTLSSSRQHTCARFSVGAGQHEISSLSSRCSLTSRRR